MRNDNDRVTVSFDRMQVLLVALVLCSRNTHPMRDAKTDLWGNFAPHWLLPPSEHHLRTAFDPKPRSKMHQSLTLI